MDSGVITWKCRDTYVEMAVVLTGAVPVAAQSTAADKQSIRSLRASLHATYRSRDVLSCLPASPVDCPTSIQQLQTAFRRLLLL